MENHPTTFLFLFLVNLLIVGASSPDVLECLADEFQSSNLPTADVIYTPQTPSYANLLQAENLRAASTSPEKPLVILTPYNEAEIQAAIHCCRNLGIQIRVRSGGHDNEGLSYTSEVPFIMIDLRNLRSVTIDAAGKTAWVQTGATLGQLYYTLAQRSKTLAFPAGSCPTVGVGGHMSGGGYSMMSRKHSIAADHIIDAKIINADGEILDRRGMGEDLFWAIRGGGAASFGVVLEFRINLVTVPGTVTVFNINRTSEQNVTGLVHRWQHIADRVDENLEIRVALSSLTSSKIGKRTILASFLALYLGPARDLLPLMQEKFPELGLVQKNCIEMSWVESILFFQGKWGQPLEFLLDRTPSPSYYKGKSDYVATPIPVKGLKGIWKFLHEEDETHAMLQFSPYGGAFNAFSESEIPFPHRSGNIFMIEYVVGWMNPNESEVHVGWMRRLHNYMTPHVTKSPRASYINYRDLDIGRNNVEGNTSYEQAKLWGLRYFKNNFKRLVRVKVDVDPSNFFKNEQSIPPVAIPEEGSSWM